LWVSREILDKHHATIRVRSRQTPGASGTVFSIWIPETMAAKSDE
jgi:signal transduction histidine kinase